MKSSSETEFGTLPTGARFFSQGRLYVKIDKKTGEMLRLPSGDVPDRTITHLFYPENVVAVEDSDP